MIKGDGFPDPHPPLEDSRRACPLCQPFQRGREENPDPVPFIVGLIGSPMGFALPIAAGIVLSICVSLAPVQGTPILQTVLSAVAILLFFLGTVAGPSLFVFFIHRLTR